MDDTALGNWEEFYDAYAGRMLLFAKQFVGCPAAAEDVVQEGFVRFWKHRKEHETEKREARLFGCVRWAALDWLRKAKRDRQREDRYGEEEAALGGGDCFECPLENREMAALVESALERLPGEQREVVALKVWAGLTLQEIGEALGISPNTAASRYRYALAAMKRELSFTDYAQGNG